MTAIEHIQEMLFVIRNKGYTSREIAFIGSADGEYSVKLNDIIAEAIKSERDDADVPGDTIMVMADGAKFRFGYDPCEGWGWILEPPFSPVSKPAERFFCEEDDATFADLNG